MPDLRPESLDLRLARLDLKPERLDLRPERLDLRPERLDLRPERLDLRSERLDLSPERLDLRSERPDLKPERLNLRPERLEKLRRGGRMDKRTDGQTDGWTDIRTYGNSPLCPTGHLPFGAAAQKGEANMALRRRRWGSRFQPKKSSIEKNESTSKKLGEQK